MTLNFRYSFGYSFATLCSVLLASPASAVDITPTETVPTPPIANETSDARIYTPEFFAKNAPQTARDMVARIPGFQLSGGQSGRGFGQASLNLVINGQRPSSKSSGAQEILGRIPADTVVRIEIVDGTTLDIPGLTGQVANVITLQTAKLSGNWRYAARFEEGTQPQLLEAALSVSGSRGNLDYVISVENDTRYRSELGDEFFADANGTPFETRNEKIFQDFNRPSLDVNLTLNRPNGHIANLNATIDRANRQDGNREQFTALSERGQTGQSFSTGGEDEVEYEIGGDYALPLNGVLADTGTLKLIALHRFENSITDNGFDSFVDGEDAYISQFDQDQDEGEYVGRAEYNWSARTGSDWQLSLEGAFNYLDNTSVFTDSFTDPIQTNVRVEEKRAETNLTHSRILSERLSVQASIGAEISELSVPTSTQEPRSFIRPKGFLSASYDLSDDLQLVGRVSRVVNQLNFGTFVSSISLSEDFASSGNENIVPAQEWSGELELELTGTGALSGTLEAFVILIDSPIEQILFDDGSEGPGNLDSAMLYGLSANGTLRLDNYGLPGGELDVSGALQDSAIDDPVTDISRRIGGTQLWRYNFTLRQDIPNTNYAWAVGADQDRRSLSYRIDQTFDGHTNGPFHFVTLTHKDILGMRLDVQIQNPFGFEIERPRVIYDTDRNGPVIERQSFIRKRGKRIGFKVSDTF